MKEKIDAKDVAAAIEFNFKDCEVIDQSVIYYPYYQVRLAGKRKTRVINISAITGKEV